MNKKGFTIIELMAVLIIIAILATLVIGGIIRYSDDANDTYYESLKKQIDLAGKSYYSDNPKIRPHGEIIDGQKVIGKKLYVNELLQNNYLINDVVGANGEDCNESYLVVKMEEGNYSYDVCLICNGIAYNDKDKKICEITDESLLVEDDRNIIFDIEDTSPLVCVLEKVNDILKININKEVSNISYSFNDGEYGSANTYAVTKNGTYFANVKVGDDVTYCGSVTISDMDNTPPVVTASDAGNMNIKVTVVENDSEVESYCVNTSSTDVTNCDISEKNSSKNFTTASLDTFGPYYVHVKDSSGNWGHSNSVNFKMLLSNYVNSLNGKTTGTGKVVNENGYRYEGDNPNNYVCFGVDKTTCLNDTTSYLYRIIGSFNGNTLGGTSGTYYGKIIKNVRFTKGASPAFSYDDSDSTNAWTSTSLYNNLNGSSGKFYPTLTSTQLSYLYKAKWYLGGVDENYYGSASAYTTANFYLYERSSTGGYSKKTLTSTTAYVGLMYPSDYGYAVLSNVCPRITALERYDETSACQEENWLYYDGNYTGEWTITPSRSELYAFIVGDYYGGYVYSDYVSEKVNIRPSMYLNSNVYIVGGAGTVSNPFIIGY